MYGVLWYLPTSSKSIYPVYIYKSLLGKLIKRTLIRAADDGRTAPPLPLPLPWRAPSPFELSTPQQSVFLLVPESFARDLYQTKI